MVRPAVSRWLFLILSCFFLLWVLSVGASLLYLVCCGLVCCGGCVGRCSCVLLVCCVGVLRWLFGCVALSEVLLVRVVSCVVVVGVCFFLVVFCVVLVRPSFCVGALLVSLWGVVGLSAFLWLCCSWCCFCGRAVSGS